MPILHWLNDEEAPKTSTHIPYRLLEADSTLLREKRNLGELWEEKSKKKALFLMAVERDEQGRDVYKQVEDKIKK